ncbi:MAG: metal-sensing transcriptional repressor [Bacilli bacterium]|nr:metal-sensing transcriptional repressor [Bacilli bacterium]MBN2696764.1 metal-sensing transcriptional repressor [Bacilli bacterium]
MKADHKEVLKRLSLARGQIDGIIRMVEADRYCIDISNQLLATISLLKNANQSILKAHLNSCVRETLTDEGSEKIDEIIKIIEKISK